MSAQLPSFVPDLSRATIPLDDLRRQAEKYQQETAKAASAAAAAAADMARKAANAAWWWVQPFTWVIVFVVVAVGLLFLIDWLFYIVRGYDFLGIKAWNPTDIIPSSNILYIDSGSTSYVDTSGNNIIENSTLVNTLNNMIVDQTTIPSFTVGYAILGGTRAPTTQGTLTIGYYQGNSMLKTYTAVDGTITPSLPQQISTKATAPPSTSPFSNLFSFMGNSDLAPSYHNATSSATIPASKAPLSNEKDGGYGMQWWMFIQDWNYGYGKSKSIVKRPDTTNSAVQNPSISLHPTDNSLQVSVSIFPSSEGGSSKITPAPAGHSGSSDDVFTCEVPNIPLQTWFSVSVTVFGRNLDIYIDGKLVKSCFLSGVPKPTIGDIQLTPDGGFSGRICNFYHYPRMLTPADAFTFYSAGTSCRHKTQPSSAAQATGYSVKFGVYDTLGKNIQEYTF